ncbi:MAG: CotH kinase family protein [Lachnospiraceae bacterium]|nr:CotH kinase family protein [Lachnospiraceae bacterium]
MKIYGKMLAALGVLLPVIALSGCAQEVTESLTSLISADETWEKEDASVSYALEDKASLYEDENNEVITVYLTVGLGNSADGTNYTWEEVNAHSLSYYEELGIDPYMCEAVLQVGDENGPVSGEFGYGETAANATVRLRGEGASEREQKSYRIEIMSGKGSWDDQKVIILNKQSSDEIRITNKLAYTLMQDIPGMISVRTQLVHLYVKDKTEGENGLFVDYGLYTKVEQINKTYLKNHGFDSSGQLYKAESFDWARHEDSIQMITAEGYDLEKFEQYLEVKGDEDHTGLIEALEAVNNYNIDFGTVLDTYFDRDNLYSWLAFHMLTGNKSVAEGSYYLYSPQTEDTWYFISWNNEDAFYEIYERIKDENYDPSWNTGIFSFTGCVLFERIFSDPDCREEFAAVMEEMYSEYLTEERIESLAQELAENAKPYIYSLPDSFYQKVNSTVYDQIVNSLADEVAKNYQYFLTSLNQPWPFHILEPETDETTLTLKWEESQVIQDPDSDTAQTVTYTVELSDSWSFTNCIVSETGMEGTSLTVELPTAGQYFVRVRAVTSLGYTQDAYEYYYTQKDTTVYSTQCFYIREDGSVELSLYVEE